MHAHIKSVDNIIDLRYNENMEYPKVLGISHADIYSTLVVMSLDMATKYYRIIGDMQYAVTASYGQKLEYADQIFLTMFDVCNLHANWSIHDICHDDRTYVTLHNPRWMDESLADRIHHMNHALYKFKTCESEDSVIVNTYLNLTL